MPLITPFPDDVRAYVRVEVNWADTPAVQFAKVLRVDPATGECVPLRPYVCFDGDYLRLSCGHGLFWDTELPLDTEVYYRTEGVDAPCIPAADPCAPCVPVTAQTAVLTMASGGVFAFGDPVRPCNDVRVPLCFTQPTGDPACIPGSGIFFASMGDEQIDANSIDLLPTNASLPITMSRQMRGISSVLTLVTRTFADRDALKALLKPGGPVLFRGVHAPKDYGIDNEYLSINPLSIGRGLSNHTYPVRINDMPYLQTRRPAGPSQGVCGTRVQDMCDVYSTWQQIDNAGLTWEDLLRGRASHDGGDPIGDYRTWTIGTNTVLADFANWNAVNTLGRDWTDLEVGN